MTTTTISLSQFAKKVSKMGARFEEIALRGLQSSAYRLQGMVPEAIAETSPYPPSDTGEMAHAKVEMLPKGAAVIVDAPHAAIMEYGTRPFFPRIAPIAEWVFRKGLADNEEDAEQIAWLIAWKFKAHGIAPRHYMRRAIATFKRRKILVQEIKAELKEAGL